MINSRLRTINSIPEPESLGTVVLHALGDLRSFGLLLWAAFSTAPRGRDELVFRGVALKAEELEAYRGNTGKLVAWSHVATFTRYPGRRALTLSRTESRGFPFFFELRYTGCPLFRTCTWRRRAQRCESRESTATS